MTSANKPYCKQTGQVRFWRKVSKRGPRHSSGSRCWIWCGYKFVDGYGGIMVNRVIYRAHRYSWLIHYGPVPLGKMVLHRCDTPTCVNPKHLFIGTAKENKTDCVDKGRHAHGEKHGESKLTNTAVRDIRKLYRKGVRGQGATCIGRKFGVSKPVILGIIHGTGWKHV